MGTSAIDRRLDVLADRRRRELCRYLHTADSSEFTCSELAEQLSNLEGSEGARPAGVASLERNLRHVHLPKLDDAGVIEYEPVDGRLVANDRRVGMLFDVLETVTEGVDDGAAGPDTGTAAE